MVCNWRDNGDLLEWSTWANDDELLPSHSAFWLRPTTPGAPKWLSSAPLAWPTKHQALVTVRRITSIPPTHTFPPGFLLTFTLLIAPAQLFFHTSSLSPFSLCSSTLTFAFDHSSESELSIQDSSCHAIPLGWGGLLSVAAKSCRCQDLSKSIRPSYVTLLEHSRLLYLSETS